MPISDVDRPSRYERYWASSSRNEAEIEKPSIDFPRICLHEQMTRLHSSIQKHFKIHIITTIAGKASISKKTSKIVIKNMNEAMPRP